MINTTQLNVQYYDELINRLFNPKSYFFNCINKYLNKIVNKNSIDQDIVYLIKNFIHLFVESDVATYELQAISDINGFQDFYPKLKEKIENVDFTTSTPDKIKGIINKLANFVIHQLIAILKNFDSRKSLAKYLGLESSVSDYDMPEKQEEINVLSEKTNIETPLDDLIINDELINSDEQIIKESNHLEKKQIIEETDDKLKYELNSDVIASFSNDEINHSKNDSKIDVTFEDNNEILSDFFKKDILNVLNSLQSYKKISILQKDEKKFLKNWEICSEEIKMIAMMHGYDDIEAIAIRMLRVISYFRTSSISPDNQVLLLFIKAKEVIQNILSNEKNIDIKNIINLFDNYLINPNDLIFDNKNIDFIEESNEQIKEYEIKEKQKDENVNHIIEIDDNEKPSDTNQDIFKIPGEDDPELLSLINEIQNNEEDSTNESLDDIIDENIPEVKDDNLNFIFQEHDINHKKLLNIDSSLYFKLLNQAMKKLVHENSDESALEDLELASSSLKSYALKFGFEKLGELPLAIEKISYKSIEFNVGIPDNILQFIAEAILLLQTFSDDIKQREKFKSIMFNLNQYLNRLVKQRKIVTDF